MNCSPFTRKWRQQATLSHLEAVPIITVSLASPSLLAPTNCAGRCHWCVMANVTVRWGINGEANWLSYSCSTAFKVRAWVKRKGLPSTIRPSRVTRSDPIICCGSRTSKIAYRTATPMTIFYNSDIVVGLSLTADGDPNRKAKCLPPSLSLSPSPSLPPSLPLSLSLSPSLPLSLFHSPSLSLPLSLQ